MPKKILKIKNLKKVYHTDKEEITAVSDVSFDLYDGEILAIVGPSGCGKSTILSMIGGLETISSGEIIKDEKTKLGYMLQKDCLFEWRTILNNCLLGLEISNQNNEENKKYVLKLLNEYGLKNFINNMPNELSGGMRQRVALIRTLASKPDILMLDEPFSALDYQSRLAVSDNVYQILKKEKKSAIMVTHDIAEAISMADRVIVLTERPSKIKKIYEINLTDKSTPINNRKCLEFSDYYDKLWKDLDFHV